MSLQKIIIFTLAITFFLTGCKKLVEINPPENQMTTSEVFTDSASVDAVVGGMYSFMYNYNRNDGSPYKTFISSLTALTADEATYFSSNSYAQYERNAIPVADSRNLQLWADSYTVIYMANNILEHIDQLQSSSAAYRNQISGEALFIRAFCHFYLTNMFGDVPIITQTDVSKTGMLPRSSQAGVYGQIIKDLKNAEVLMSADYRYSGDERTRVNKFGATAMLSRVYLYMKNYTEAKDAATRVIENTSLYRREDQLVNVFLTGSSEAILEFSTNIRNATWLAIDALPNPNTGIPRFLISDQLLAAFDPGDLRLASWIGSVEYGGKVYRYPNKYKLNGATIPSPELAESEMVLRLSEQYLIRAEARTNLDDLGGAKKDLDIIRQRAGILPVAITDKQQMLADVEHERQLELFFEWGHRWFDLKRTGRASAILGPIKSTWKNSAVLFPVPQEARNRNQNLSQNLGYN